MKKVGPDYQMGHKKCKQSKEADIPRETQFCPLKMTGENCAIPKCGTSRRNKGIGIFKVPAANNEFNKKWSQDLINIILKYRERDASLNERIKSHNLYICERHFTPDQIYVYPTRKTLKEGALPTLNFPRPSANAVVNNRSTSAIEKREEHLALQAQLPQPQPSHFYKSFEDFKQRIKTLVLNKTWSIDIQEDLVIASLNSPEYALPTHEIYVDNQLNFILRIHSWVLPVEHQLYSEYNSSFLNVTFSNFIKVFDNFKLCQGITVPDSRKEINFIKHVLPKKFNYFSYTKADVKVPVCQDHYFRSRSCELLVSSSDISCKSCHEESIKFNKEINRKKSVLNEPAKLNAPIKFTSPKRIKITLQQNRLQCKQLEEQISNMKKALLNESKPVSPELSTDFQKIFSQSNAKDVPPFMKLFWQEQQKYITSSSYSSIRYHPMVIKFCLNLAAKSSSAYKDLRYDSKTGTGILVLPSLRTLRDYKNYIRPTRGFNPAIVSELAEKTANFSDIERYVTILFDEMKIQENLVWDKHTGELIGFVDLGDINVNFATLKNVEKLATHVLVFLIKSVVNPLSYSFATFATDGITAFQIMPIFWQAVKYLEFINLKVIAATADGAAFNRKFFTMHKYLMGDSDSEIIYRAKNIYTKEMRFIYFFADAPHLIKTVRNCLYNSGFGRATRYMWNNGFFILWSHISRIYNQGLESGLKLVEKLSSDHIKLTSYSVMRVNLAAQVLSEQVGNVLNNFFPEDAQGTGEFCLMMDKFFDCLNVRNTQEHITKRKPFLKPYESIDDIRFEWLDEFLNYFESWKDSIERRNDANFTDNARARMFISWQSYVGLQTTVFSFKEVCKFLLQQGIPYILSERFCQDDLENYFGKQRAILRRCDNPTVRDVGYNDNTIKSQFSVRPIAGNVQGSAGKFNEISNEPLPKRRKRKHDD